MFLFPVYGNTTNCCAPSTVCSVPDVFRPANATRLHIYTGMANSVGPIPHDYICVCVCVFPFEVMTPLFGVTSSNVELRNYVISRQNIIKSSYVIRKYIKSEFFQITPRPPWGGVGQFF